MSDLPLLVPDKPSETLREDWRRSLGSALPAWNASSDFVSKAAGTYFTQLTTAGLSFVTAVIVARLLGPAGRGDYAVATAIGALGVQFGNFGLGTSNTYLVGKDRGLLAGLLANSLLLSFIIGGIASGVGAYLALRHPTLMPVHGPLLALALCWVPFGLAYQLSQNLTVGVQEVRAYNLIELANKLLALFLIGCLFALNRIATVTAFAVVFGALTCGLLLSVTRLWRLAADRLVPSLALFRRGLGLGLRAYMASFLAFLLIRLDLLMVKYMLGAEQAGYYSIAGNMADYILLLPTAVAMILFPKLSAMKDPDRQWSFAGRVTWGAACLLLPLIGVCALLARPAIGLAFGKAYLPSIAPFLFLLPGVFCLGLEIIVVQFLNSVGFPLSVVIAWLVVVIVKFAMNLWMIPHYGIKGASIASTLCYSLMLIMVLGIIHSQWKRSVADQQS